MQLAVMAYKNSNMPRHYDTVMGLFKAHNIFMRDFYAWHLSHEKHGHVNGIPSMHGTLVAENGHLGLLERGDELLLIHTQWFIPDVQMRAEPQQTRRSACKADAQLQQSVDLDAYLATLL
jgi:hypothetical protein